MPHSDILDSWKRRRCVIATMHGKEKVIAPLLQKELGITLVVPTDFNTDKFGTFTREILRTGNQLDTAREKAMAAMSHTGLDLAVASEGSFSQYPNMPFISSNLELVILLDKSNDIEIVGHYRTTNVKMLGQEIGSAEEAVKVACSWGFPEQGVIVRRSEKSKRYIHKEITAVEELTEVCQRLLSKWFAKTIWLETDMRAHRCPDRLHSINEASLDLINNCKSYCPQCTTPGFIVTDVKKGLPCRYCGLPTDLAKELIYSCNKCLYTETLAVKENPVADQGQCGRCNP